MKVAFLTPEYPHAKTGGSGGIGSSIANLGNGLSRMGHEVSVLVFGQAEDEVFTDGGITFYRIRNIKFKGLSWWLTRKKIQQLINRLHGEGKIDVVEAPDWGGITSYIKTKCPLVIRLHGSDTYFCHLDKRPVKPINFHHEKRALQNADALLSVSDYTAQKTRELFKLARDFTIIPNAVDTGIFKPSGTPKPNEILYFGTLIRKKGLLELPLIFNEVIKQVPDARLTLLGKDSSDVITGSPSTWKLMQPLFSSEALQRVHYAGPVPYDQMKEKIAMASVCVFPTFAEALPVSWIEAMAMEKAVVASNIGWAPEVITHGHDGFLASPTSHMEFASHIVSVLRDSTLRDSVRHNARKTILAQFDTLVVVARNVEFYQKLIS